MGVPIHFDTGDLTPLTLPPKKQQTESDGHSSGVKFASLARTQILTSLVQMMKVDSFSSSMHDRRVRELNTRPILTRA